MMPEWLRILITIFAGVWMIVWIIVCGRLLVRFHATVIGKDKEKAVRRADGFFLCAGLSP